MSCLDAATLTIRPGPMRVRKLNRDPAYLLSPIQLVSSLLVLLLWPFENRLLRTVIIYGALFKTNANNCPCFLFSDPSTVRSVPSVPSSP